jgi:hypothetical protein
MSIIDHYDDNDDIINVINMIVMITFHIYSGGDLPCAVARWNYSTSIPSLLSSSSLASSSSSGDIMNSNTLDIIIDRLWVLPRLRRQQYAYRCLHSIVYHTITNIMTQTTTPSTTTTTTTTTTNNNNDSIKSNSSQGNIKIKILKEILSHYNYNQHNKDNNDNTDDDNHNISCNDVSDTNSNQSMNWMIEKLKSFGFIVTNDDQHHYHMNDHNDYHSQQKSSSIVGNNNNNILNLNHNVIIFSLSYQSNSTLQDLLLLLQSKCNM